MWCFIVYKAKSSQQLKNENKVRVLEKELSELKGKSHALPFKSLIFLNKTEKFSA